MSAPSMAACHLPVRVFLSYCHRDQEWKDDLKRAFASLLSSGYVAVWDDRKVPAGSQWEDQIEAQLGKAGIVLLLISEDYMNSEYCRRERDIAIELQRRNPDRRRVIPIFMKRVALIGSDPVLAFQGLPRNMKWADDWHPHEQNKPRSLIAEGVLEEVYALSGQAARKTGTSTASPSPRLDPRYVDRDTQEREFKDFWDVASWSRHRAAQIYLLPALDIDCPDYFVQRLREDTVERLARSFKSPSKASTDPILVSSEPRYHSLELLEHDLSRDLFEQFDALDFWNSSQPSAKKLGSLDRVQRYAFVTIEQTVRADAAGAMLAELLSWYVNVFWADFHSDTHFLVFLHLAYRMPESSRHARLFSWLSGTPTRQASPRVRLGEHLKQFVPDGRGNLLPDAVGAPVKLLPELMPIELEDLRIWLRRLGVAPHEIDATAARLLEDVHRKFRDTRLSYVYGPLDQFYESYLNKKSKRSQGQPVS
jgi:hypothetical protein